MTIKDILLVLDASDAAENRIGAAAALARHCGARLVGLYARPTDLLAGMLTSEPYLDASLLDQMEKFDKDRHGALKQRFEAATAGLIAEWRSAEGEPLRTIARHSPYFDLVVGGQEDPAMSAATTRVVNPAELLRQSGRPVLMVPRAGTFEAPPRHVMIAWNASRVATRALHDAMPLLCAADKVTLTVIMPNKPPEEPRDASGAEVGVSISQHLARHGVTATVNRVPIGDKNPGDLLLSHAASIKADLIVAGSYGRGQFTEMLLGGTTRSLLKSMNLPILMAH